MERGMVTRSDERLNSLGDEKRYTVKQGKRGERRAKEMKQ